MSQEVEVVINNEDDALRVNELKLLGQIASRILTTESDLEIFNSLVVQRIGQIAKQYVASSKPKEEGQDLEANDQEESSHTLDFETVID